MLPLHNNCVNRLYILSMSQFERNQTMMKMIESHEVFLLPNMKRQRVFIINIQP